MKKITFILISSIILAVFFTSCNKDETLDGPSSVSVSQGTYMGIVHLNWDPVTDAQYYNIERQSPDGNWLNAGTVTTPPFDDYGFNLPDNRITYGTHYSYRISSANHDKGDSPFLNAQEQGWTYILKPIELTVTNEGSEMTLSWRDTNVYVTNFSECFYKIQQKTTNADIYTTIHTTDHLIMEESYTYSFTSSTQEDITASYKIDGIYTFKMKNMDQEGASGQCNNESNEADVTGGGGGSTSSYLWASLGSFGNSANGINFIKEKVYDNTLYAAIIDNPTSGKPVLYQSDGSNFSSISGTYPDAFLNNFEKIDFAVKSGTKYLAGISDSAYVFSYDGNWSNNLAAQNLGYADKPQALSIETDGQDIFAAIFTNDNNLVVKTWSQDAVWNDNANIENSDAISNVNIIQLNGQVYLYYLRSNSAYNSTLVIKHYTGISWETDLEWTRDNLMDVQLSADAGSNLFFVSNSQQPGDWAGSVFKVTSNTDAEDLLSVAENWIVFPSGITVNSDGDIMVVYTHVVSASQVNPELAVYKDNIWSKVSGDYTNGLFPAEINHINQDFYFIYGDAQTATGNGYPLNLKANKLTKN